MEKLRPPAKMTDDDILHEYEATNFDVDDWRRTDALIAEMNSRGLDF